MGNTGKPDVTAGAHGIHDTKCTCVWRVMYTRGAHVLLYRAAICIVVPADTQHKVESISIYIYSPDLTRHIYTNVIELIQEHVYTYSGFYALVYG